MSVDPSGPGVGPRAAAAARGRSTSAAHGSDSSPSGFRQLEEQCVAALLGWRGWGLALVTMLVVTVAAAELPDAWSAAHGGGVTGTFTAHVALSCGRGGGTGCAWEGTFDSTDGSVHAETVRFDSPSPQQTGGTVPVRFLRSNPTTVYAAVDDRAWAWMAGVGGAAALYLLAFAGALLHRTRSRGPGSVWPPFRLPRRSAGRHA